MKQYAWIMAACLTAAMVSGCGVAQKGEAGNGSESTATSSERSEVVVPEGTEAETGMISTGMGRKKNFPLPLRGMERTIIIWNFMLIRCR